MIKTVEEFLIKIGHYDYVYDYDWEFHLDNKNEVNAYCMSGGKILAYPGIFQIVDDEEKLVFSENWTFILNSENLLKRDIYTNNECKCNICDKKRFNWGNYNKSTTTKQETKLKCII